jgi:hypothetical protein
VSKNSSSPIFHAVTGRKIYRPKRKQYFQMLWLPGILIRFKSRVTENNFHNFLLCNQIDGFGLIKSIRYFWRKNCFFRNNHSSNRYFHLLLKTLLRINFFPEYHSTRYPVCPLIPGIFHEYLHQSLHAQLFQSHPIPDRAGTRGSPYLPLGKG